MKFSQLVEVTKGQWINQSEDLEVDHLIFDSRLSNGLPNEIFIALKGNQVNGQQFIPELISKGVRAFIVEEPVNIQHEVNLCLVDNSLKAFQKLGAYKRQLFQGKVIAITGSNGKTIIKEWLHTILSAKYSCTKSPKSYNSQIGVPFSLWLLQNNTELGIIEAGISQPSEMSRLEELIHPEIGVFTNIGSAHGENFDSIDEKLAEKAKLFAHSQMVICHSKDPRIISQLEKLNGPKVISWGFRKSDQYRFSHKDNLVNIDSSFQGSFTFHLRSDRIIYLENICHIIVVALELGLKQNEIQTGLDLINFEELRLSLKRGVRGNYLIDDTYNNDLEGLKLALEFMEQQRLQEQRVLIISDLVQSKLEQEEIKQLATIVQHKSLEQIIVIGNQLKNAFEKIPLTLHHYESTNELIQSGLLNQYDNKLILVKGSRKFHFESIIQLLAQKTHKTRLEIDLNAIIHNLKEHKQLLDKDTKVMVMIKAFAYGAGSLELARLLEYQKVDYFAVAYVDEAVELRNNGIKSPIMVMNASIEDAKTLMQFDLEPEIYSCEQLLAYIDIYSSTPNSLPCHIIVNTGMNRLGFEPEESDRLIQIIEDNPAINVKSIFTHLASADEQEHDHFTELQIRNFEHFAHQLTQALHIKPLLHCLNSSGIVRFSWHQKDMVRLGIGLHGVSSKQEFSRKLKFPAQLKSTISQIREIQAGETIGYGRKAKALKRMKVATVAIGYADGYHRLFGNSKAFMMLNGFKAYTIGNVCMDMTMLDITNIEAKVGDDVIVFGHKPSILDLAQWSGTIPYEILTNVSGRVQRIFHSD